MPLLQQFLARIARLNRGGTKYGKAPHKPVLLLAFVDLFEKGLLNQNRVYVDADLVGAFLENWRLLVDTPHTADFTQPFYHLQSERLNNAPFWFLKPKPGCSIYAPIKSVRILAEVLEYGHFSTEVFLLLSNAASRAAVKNVLLNTYFPQYKAAYLQSKEQGRGYMMEMEHFILNEPETQYRTIHTAESEEDIFVRGGLFKKIVPQIYNSTCCITGMRLESAYGHTFIDACHIVPFSVSHNDKINNGIALCPNLHRAFDRGLISIDSNYRVQVSAGLIEYEQHPYNLKQFKNQPIKLPADSRYHPDPANLEWHGREVFRG